MSQPNPSAEVVRATRAYLAALLPAGDVADAWHDVLGDVRYWDETDLTSVLKIAHGVVQQRQRATQDARYLALTQDAGLSDPAALAEILSVDPSELVEMEASTVAAMTEPVVIPEPAVAAVSQPAAAPASASSSAGPSPTPSPASSPAAPTPVDPPAAPPEGRTAGASPNGTIRFHAEAGSIDPIGELQRKVDVPIDQATKVSGRTMLVWAVVVWAVVLVLFTILR